MDATTRSVIIGTEETIAALVEQVWVAAPGFRALGCIVADRCPAHTIGGLRVLGTVDDLANIQSAIRFGVAVVSLPSAMTTSIARVRAILREIGVSERAVPPLRELLASPGPVARASADVSLVDLIGREPYGMDRRAVASLLDSKRILITGAGGSIGSEITRIAATFHPELLIMMERSENALFEIDRQVARRFPNVPRKALLHDVVDAEGTRRLVGELRPHVVFHAAAHKHVPLMEDHPAHAVNNNFFGTKSILDAAVSARADRFVLISSDKAVNPSSVMGATKRLAEMYTQAVDAESRAHGGTRCASVRFGNVLGSACSVLPIWQSQLAEGGPLTVTDERMTRFFMTIHEAATLVIQSAAITPDPARSPVFVLDMGEPIRILDLAERFVRLHGLEPRTLRTTAPRLATDPLPTLGTIDIQITGIRPGEKLHEELAYAAENLVPTPHAGIRAWATEDPAPAASEMVADLEAIRNCPDRGAVLAAIKRHVPHMKSDVYSDNDSNMFVQLAAA